MKYLLLIALVIGLGNACSCMAPGTPAEELAKSDAVFLGKVESVTLDESSPLGGYDVVLRVQRSWKGASSPTVAIHTGLDSAGCGFPFSQGGEYLVYATESDDGLYAGLCSRTARASDAAADIEALGSGSAASPAIEWAILVIVILLVVAAVVLVKKR